MKNPIYLDKVEVNTSKIIGMTLANNEVRMKFASGRVIIFPYNRTKCVTMFDGTVLRDLLIDTSELNQDAFGRSFTTPDAIAKTVSYKPDEQRHLNEAIKKP